MGKHTIILLTLFCVNFIFAKSQPVQNIKSVAIYWDASFSQKDKKIEKEFEFLDAFFKANPNSKVQLIIFNTKIIQKENLEIKSSNWNVLKEKLKQVTYDGASDFSLVNTELEEKMLLFFTDGYSNFGNFEASLYSPRIITISSKIDIDKKFLHNTAFYNRGYHVNLLESDISSSIKAINNEVIMPKLEFVTGKNIDTKKNYISGIVVGKSQGLPNVNISVNGKNRGTITDENGNYKVAAEPGDVLLFSSINMKSAVVEISDKKVINVQLTELMNELGPAIVTSKKRSDPQMVTLNDRKVDLRTLGYAVQSIGEDEIQGDTKRDLGSAMAGKFAGVSLSSNGVDNTPSAGQTRIRGMNSILLSNHAFFVVDGIPLPQSGVGIRQSENYDFIQPNTIKSITILKGLAATNRYGSAGRNGVVLITTKIADSKLLSHEEDSNDISSEVEYKIYGSSLQVDNQKDLPFYSMFKKFEDYKEAYKYYLSRIQFNKDNITFFVECSDYFFSIDQPEIGVKILSNLIEIFPNDTSVLKIAAFNLETHNVFDKAQTVYQRIIDITPSLSQTYLDLANAYISDKKYQESVNLFKKMTKNEIKEINSFEGLNTQLTNDFKSLLSNRNQSWRVKNIDQKYFNTSNYDLRVVTEWSHPQTEFSVQYINSKKQYFTLTHNQEENKKAMQQELKEGYTSDEYVLSDIEVGEWFLNVVIPDDYTPDPKYPKFLKVKVFTKFGTPQQKLETHVINLDRIAKNKIFTSFRI